MQIAFAGSMKYMFSMFNGLQVAESQSQTESKVPGNAITFLGGIHDLANFAIINLESALDRWFYWPDRDAFSINMQGSGQDSVFFLKLIKGQLLYCLMLTLLVGVDIILKYASRKFAKAQTIRDKTTKKFLYWNWTIRFFMEIYMSFSLFAFVGLASLEWDSPFASVRFCNFLTLAIVIVILVVPAILIRHLIKNMKKLNDKSFKDKFGTLISEVELNPAMRKVRFVNLEENYKVVVIIPAMHFARRMVLVLAITYLKG